MKKLVIHMLKSNIYSGAENIAISLIKSLQNLFPGRYELVYASPDGYIRQILEAEKIPYEPLKKLSFAEIRKVIRQYRPALIHAHDFTASLICALTDFKIPMISHLHNNPPWIKTLNLKTLAYRFTLSRFSVVVGVSKPVIDEFWFKSIRKKSKIISNPIDIRSIRTRAQTQVDEHCSGSIVFLGRLTKQKNPLRFIRLVAELSRTIPELSAIMIGDGKFWDECTILIKNLGLDDRIKMAGFMENPYPVLARSKVLCMPSLWEGFGLAAVEALTLGIPVTASPVGGLPRLVDETCGALCGDDQSFVTAILELLGDPVIWEAKSKAAAKKAESLENIQSYAREMNRLYENII